MKHFLGIAFIALLGTSSAFAKGYYREILVPHDEGVRHRKRRDI
jgi:hypothetical protein